MRGLAPMLVAMAALLAGPASGQDAPAPRPDHPAADRPAPRPEPEAEAESEAEVAPEPAAEPVPEPETPENAAAEAAPAASAPTGPPIRATLRESDFDHSACLLELTLLGADYSEAPPILDPDQRDCGIDRPVLLRQPLPGIEIPGGAPMRCDLARHLAHWLRDFVRPAAALLPGQPRLVALEPGSTYQCRPTVGTAGESLSEHAFGNAFDIAAFRFDDGSRIEVGPRQDNGDLQEAFQRAARGTACLHFTTVLGPGANAAHDDHLHLDIKARRGGFRLCQ
ncbi:extensin family protein [Paracoccus sp. P2]|uniref:Extensin family protein n=1 Tax=Paracoccus pantotrophus TaxID=82367 RepID=A0A7H9BWC0_PARPN|nr:extensin family protein [Paracoccus pantotrophus]MDF3855973.1 extensin family protein [Paracoccus pantotrophus]QLH15422.1 extensin family protein [Paracoccus pantotrophus]RNI20542.1 extensin [Paracoccus pantotrophus]WGR65565.1 extensin family protein [Paracoccus pantotrophus]SFO91778.1 Uncharacterized conserved protein [Paracoccus pantotrophus]